MKILITGGAGYIGSHICVELLAQGHDVCIYDNLANSSSEVVSRIEKISGKSVYFILGDILDVQSLRNCFASFHPDSVIHLAGLKSVSDSVKEPLDYFNVNVVGSVKLLKAMTDAKCSQIIFSSSATVYGNPSYLPFDEKHPVKPMNPYGRSKIIVEDMLRDWVASNSNHNAVCLRYFNPIGAHSSGLIGESSRGVPSNLMPYLTQVAAGKRDILYIFGMDYDTRDGTAERDYIHVSDLSLAHVKSLNIRKSDYGFLVLNVGTGHGTTVLELLKIFEAEIGVKLNKKIIGRRSGDVGRSWADPSKGNKIFETKFTRSLEEMCRDSWRWQQMNPNGYQE